MEEQVAGLEVPVSLKYQVVHSYGPGPMKMTIVMVAAYILDCVLIGTKPCKYFQLNSRYFNNEKGVFSKIDLDKLIPIEWRLAQQYDDAGYIPEHFPVFLKPEWGQNASGIYRADDPVSLREIRQQIGCSQVPYIIQQGALEAREFEIFSLQHHRNKGEYSIFSVTEVINESERNPINGIHNRDTTYHDITEQFSEPQKQILWNTVCQIGQFGISRLSLRANSTEDLLAGRFHIIELNLFTPMPIHMLDPGYTVRDWLGMSLGYMWKLARLTKCRDKTLEEYPIYTKMMLYNRPGRLANLIRKNR
ncbi:MAG: hypothetical protein OXG56_09180 [Gammaproteobacteria bacterium]|nr:hypothetical protein [Gammaproteobacteria bacterium]